jgi:hypothetical protein
MQSKVSSPMSKAQSHPAGPWTLDFRLWTVLHNKTGAKPHSRPSCLSLFNAGLVVEVGFGVGTALGGGVD